MKLEFRNINKSFGDKKVLNNISFETESGKALGLLGRNGAGKTTSIRILMNVILSDSGEILIDGKPIDYSKISLGYLPEERGLYPKMKIMDQLVYLAELKGCSRSEAVKSIDYWLERLQMTEYKNKKLQTLSKGNQQKIQLITTIAHNPDIVILDEPFSGLDPVNAMLLEDVVKEEIANGKIVIFSSHQMNYIEEFCDSILIINKGEIAISGNINDIKRNYRRDKLIISSTENEKIIENSGFNCSRTENDKLLITMDNPEQKNSIMNTLVMNYDIDEIKVYEPSLNDIFVEYAGNHTEEEAQK